MVWEFGVFKFGVIALTFSYWSLEVQHGTSWQITLWGSEKRKVALHKDGIRRHGTVAKTLQRFNRTGSTQNRPLHGRPKKLNARGQHHIQMLCLGNRRMSATSIAPEVEGVGGLPVSAHTMLHTASNSSVWLSSKKEASSKDDAQESPQTVCWRQAD